jgi:two-component system sensor histidine kinase KdpD
VTGEQREGGNLEELVSVFVHELKTPIAAVQGLAATLARSLDDLDRETTLRVAEALERSARHLGELVRSFSDGQVVDGGELVLRPEPIGFAKLVRETVEELRPVLAGRTVGLELDDAPTASIDPVRIRQVLTNLLSNAAKYTPAGSPVEVTLRQVGESVELSVRDHGPGIPPEEAERVFERHARLADDGSGSGLGLYVSRELARAHGGDLVAEQPSGGGALLILRIPV